MPPAADTGSTIQTQRRCPGCGYSLRGLSREGRCPECGLPVRLPGSIDDPLSNMPPDVVRVFRTGAWLATVSLPFMVALLLLGESGRVGRWGGACALGSMAAAGIWILGVWLSTRSFNLHQAAYHGFSSRDRLRTPARWLQIAWPVAGAFALIGAIVPSQAGGLSMACGLGMRLAIALGVVGWIVLALVLERLAGWTRDDAAERAFSWTAWGIPALAVLLAVEMAFPVPVPLVVLLTSIAGLIILCMLPYGLLSLSRSLSYAVIHAEEHEERTALRSRQAARDAVRAARTVAAMDAARSREHQRRVERS